MSSPAAIDIDSSCDRHRPSRRVRFEDSLSICGLKPKCIFIVVFFLSADVERQANGKIWAMSKGDEPRDTFSFCSIVWTSNPSSFLRSNRNEMLHKRFMQHLDCCCAFCFSAIWEAPGLESKGNLWVFYNCLETQERIESLRQILPYSLSNYFISSQTFSRFQNLKSLSILNHNKLPQCYTNPAKHRRASSPTRLKAKALKCNVWLQSI